MKKIIQILLCLMLMLGYTCSAEGENTAVIEKIEIIAEKTEFEPQEEYTFSVKTYPETEEAPAVIWSIDKYFVAPIVPEAGFMVAVFPGEATVTAQLADNPEITATLDIKVLGDNTEAFKPTEVSLMLQDRLYIEDDTTENKMSMTFYSSAGGVIPENLGGVGWSQYYYAEYTDNFEGKKGITREGSTVYIANDAEPAEDLYVSVTVKRTADNEVIATGKSNSFDVVGKINISGISVNETTLEKSDDGKYYYETENTGKLTVKAEADREAYYSYQVNGGLIKRTKDATIDTSELTEEENTVVVYVFGDNRKAASGYTAKSLAETIIISLTK